MDLQIEALKAAVPHVIPDALPQRQAFARLLPHVYALRTKGCSWLKIVQVLADHGFNLQPATVRTVYAELLAERIDQRIAQLAALRSETAGRESSEHPRQAGPPPNVVTPTSSSMPDPQIIRELPTQGREDEPSDGAPEDSAEAGEFGLLGLSRAHPPSAGPAGYFDLHDDAPVTPAPASTPAPNALRICPLHSGVLPLKPRPNVPAAVYEPGDLEHPAIPGLMLSLQHRLYGAALEYVDDAGEVRIESPDEKRFRIAWRQPVPVTQTRTAGDFTQMDRTLFKS